MTSIPQHQVMIEATELLQRFEQAKTQMDMLPPLELIATFDQVQKDEDTLKQMQEKVDKLYTNRGVTQSADDDLNSAQETLDQSATILNSIENQIGIAAEYITIASKAAQLFRLRNPNPQAIAILATTLERKLSILPHARSPNMGTEKATESLRLKLQPLIQGGVDKNGEFLNDAEPQQLKFQNLISKEAAEQAVCLKNKASVLSKLVGCLERQKVDATSGLSELDKTYSQFSEYERKTLFNAYNQSRAQVGENPMPSRYLTLSFRMWPGSVVFKYEVVSQLMAALLSAHV